MTSATVYHLLKFDFVQLTIVPGDRVGGFFFVRRGPLDVDSSLSHLQIYKPHQARSLVLKSDRCCAQTPRNSTLTRGNPNILSDVLAHRRGAKLPAGVATAEPGRYSFLSVERRETSSAKAEQSLANLGF